MEPTLLAGLRRAVEKDPTDPEAWRDLAVFLERSGGDRAALEDAAWRLVYAWPTSHEGYDMLGRLFAGTPRGEAFAELASEKLLFDPENPYGAGVRAPKERPPEVAQELEPHLLIHRLHIAGPDEIEREVVDRILARAEECGRLLCGALVCFAHDLVPEAGGTLAARALALLGEIGQPDYLGIATPYLNYDEGDIGDHADWAFRRIASRRPAEALDRMRLIAAIGDAGKVADMAEQIAFVPDVPGRAEALLGLMSRLAEFSPDEREMVLLAMLTTATLLEGKHSPLAGRIRAEHAADLSRRAQAQFRKVEADLIKLGPYVAGEEEYDVYDMVCDGFELEDEELPYVRETPKIGRNDPCWCGSGKKYKKCHLAGDEARD